MTCFADPLHFFILGIFSGASKEVLTEFSSLFFHAFKFLWKPFKSVRLLERLLIP